MFLTLEVKTGNLAGRRKDIAPGQSIIIGRSDRANLVLSDDGYLSGMHLLVECREDVCHIRDLSSTNGTWVNRQRISEADLSDGDIIIAGHTVLRVWIRSAETCDSASPSPQAALRTIHFGPPKHPERPVSNPKSSIRERFNQEDFERLVEAGETEHIPREVLLPMFSPTPPPAPAVEH